MSNTCIVLRTIENVSQFIADFLTTSVPLTNGDVATLVGQIELVVGAVRELPLAAQPKADILNRLGEIQVILQNTALASIDRLTLALQLLQVVVLKVSDRKIPCAPGFVKVRPSCVFNTACHPCC